MDLNTSIELIEKHVIRSHLFYGRSIAIGVIESQPPAGTDSGHPLNAWFKYGKCLLVNDD